MYFDPSGHVVITLTTVLSAMAIGFLIGGTVAGGFEIYNQIRSNGWNPYDWNWKQIGLSALGGAVAGMISAIPVGGWLGALFLGGIGSLMGGIISGSVYNLETALLAFSIGALANLIAYGVSAKLTDAKASQIYNQSRKAKSLSVQKLQGHRLNMGSKALKGSFRNAFKDTTQAEIAGLIKNANPWIRLGIYSTSISSFLSGWY